MSDIKASVALPTYNSQKTIYDCLSSLMRQTFPRDRFEVIVGDNGSKDETLGIIARDFPSVTVIPETRRGSGYARNAAFSEARGEYICSIDSDCVADENWVASLVSALEGASPKTACLGGQILPFRRETLVEHYSDVWIQQQCLRDKTGKFRYAETPNAAFRKSVLSEVGLFDGEQGFDDADLGIRIEMAGYDLQYVPEAIVYHRNPASVKELFYHRKKYGRFGAKLANKWPEIIGPVNREQWLTGQLYPTARRIAGNLLYKQPRALIVGDSGKGTRLWPFLDCVSCLGQFVGVRAYLDETRG
jgi:cellulose synthase/poly-beta-1,6-N-acetylglucosamine synthase-like glycosyltransferase